MASAGRLVHYLNLDQIVEINIQAIAETGGSLSTAGVIINRSSLLYLLEAVRGFIGGVELCPTLFHKAAFYCSRIIQDHVFLDGNKRTGLISSILFLQLNGYSLVPGVSEDDLVDLGLKVVSGRISFDDLVEWFKNNTVG